MQKIYSLYRGHCSRDWSVAFCGNPNYRGACRFPPILKISTELPFYLFAQSHFGLNWCMAVEGYEFNSQLMLSTAIPFHSRNLREKADSFCPKSFGRNEDE